MTIYPISPPVIETDRLVLSPMGHEDWPIYREFMMGPRSIFVAGPYSEDEAWGWFTSEIAQWGLFGFGALHGRLRGADDVVVQTNITHPPAWPDIEIGYWTYDGHEGRGYAYEATRAFRDWYDAEYPDAAPLVSYVHPDNTASVRLAEKLGARANAAHPAPHEGWLTYVHPGPEVAQ